MKVVALDRDGYVRGRLRRRTPRGTDGLSVSAISVQTLIEDMIVGVCGDDCAVQAVCAVGVGEDGLLVGSDLRPLTGILAWFDPRRQRLFSRLHPSIDDQAIVDVGCDPSRSFVGWAWSRAQPGSDDAKWWLGLADLVSATWSRTPFMSDTLASRTGAWSSSSREWSVERVEATLGSLDLLPRVVRSGDVVGTLISEALTSAGVLGEQPLVVAGGHDHPVAGWGADRAVPGTVLDSMGTAEVVVAQSPLSDAARSSFVDIAPGIRTGGSTLLRVEELARNVDWVSQDPDVAHSIGAILDGSVEPLPELMSDFFLPGQRGGGRPSYRAETPEDPLVRASAVLGALARAGRDAVESVSTRALARSGVMLAGGWARSAGWVAIKERVNGFASVTLAEPEVTAVSAAMLASSALGWELDASRVLGVAAR